MTYHLKQVVKQYEAHRQPNMPETLPSLAVAMPLMEELEGLRYISPDYDEGGVKRKRKKALLTQLKPIVALWGVYMIQLVYQKKLYEFHTGFPYLMMYSLRRPASVTSFRVERNPKTGTTTMSCGKKPTLLLFFYWQASEDNQNWFTVARTSEPTLTTKKLDPHKRYFFRMFMKNPKGKSDMHGMRWGVGAF